MPNHKRIAFITNFVTPYRITFYEKLYSHQEYEWLFFHGRKQKEDGRPAHLGELNFQNQPIGYWEEKIGPFDIRWQANLFQAVQKWQPGVVITLGIPSMLTNWLVMYWAQRRGIKTITWYCGWESQSENPRSLAIKQWLLRRYMYLADHIITYSTKAKTYLSEVGVSPEKMTISYNGLEIDHLIARENEYLAKGQTLREQYQRNGNKIFLYVGGMLAEKQVPLLLEAFQAIDTNEKAVLWLVGDGPDLNTLKSMAENMNLKCVKFWGRVIEDVDVFFAAADYFVLPGVGGLALNQALFWGLPCVVSEADGTEDDLVLEGKTGFRFIPRDYNSLQNALFKCLELPETARLALGSTGRALVLERSNVNQMVNTFVKTIDQLIVA
jgi:glycosyltransferase involved in cell wall biosynthesis